MFKKEKINIPNNSFTLNLIGLSIFVTIISIFFVLRISDPNIPISKTANQSAIEDALFRKRFIIWSQLLVDVISVFVFMILMIIGRTRVEYGLLYGWGWMLLFLLITILPFVLTPDSLIKNLVIILPTIFLYIGQFLFLNELIWERKKQAMKRRKMQWL